ncbi:Protein dennd6b [Cichlidogyrus casuarinus]|uniref:Protein dennd6b n=1 Tax=Cichlidogyrus casuarinus TaxID=1844966 RepID=A0ABD2PIA0_9PLAT
MQNFLDSLSNPAFSRTKLVKGDWVNLYNPHFASWLAQRQQEVNLRLESIHLEEMCKMDVEVWLAEKNRSEIEVVDFIIVLKESLEAITTRHPHFTGANKEALRLRLERLLNYLPADLLNVIKNSISGTTICQ